MTLLPVEGAALFGTVAGWLARKENAQWLDFGNGRQPVTPALLRIMVQRDSNFLRAFTGESDDVPIGVMGFTGVDRKFGSATLWGVTGEKSFAYRGTASLAASRLLTVAFRELGLRTVNTWVVEPNQSRRSVERLHFRYIGRQRQCHLIDGEVRDRLLFDLLAAEHRELELRHRRAAYA